jgi:hypothetical protein
MVDPGVPEGTIAIFIPSSERVLCFPCFEDEDPSDVELVALDEALLTEYRDDTECDGCGEDLLEEEEDE